MIRHIKWGNRFTISMQPFKQYVEPSYHGALGQGLKVEDRLWNHITEQTNHHAPYLLIPHLDVKVHLKNRSAILSFLRLLKSSLSINV